MTEAVQIAKDPEIEAEGATWVDQAREFKVESQSDADYAGSVLPQLRVALERVAAFVAPALAKARDSVKAAEAVRAAVLAMHGELAAPFLEAEKAFKMQIAAFITGQNKERERLRSEHEEREREARAERERQERAQREFEQKAAAANLPKPAPLAPSAPMPQLDLPPPPAPIIGAQIRNVRTAKVVDKMAFLRAVVDGNASHELVTIDLAKLTKLAGVLTQPPPGVEFENVTEVAHETRRVRRK
jgi:hypothetical protein